MYIQNMKHIKNILFVLTLFISHARGQETENQEILLTDSTWQHEHFDFPLQFAPDIKFTGYEDARFPAGWSNQDSCAFWSYVFAWEVESKKKLSLNKIQTYLTYYFSGLMNDAENTSVHLSKQKLEDATSFYWGKIRSTEAFFTKKKFILNVKIEQKYCSENKVIILIFRFSPKEFDHEIWIELNKVKLFENKCN